METVRPDVRSTVKVLGPILENFEVGERCGAAQEIRDIDMFAR